MSGSGCRCGVDQTDLTSGASSSADCSRPGPQDATRCGIVIGWIPAYEHANFVAPRMEAPSVIAKVMVLEDDEDVSRAIARKLRADGFAIEESMDPVEVLRRLESGEGDWDVVILDMGLPVMTGLEVLQRFRHAGSHAACIMLTGDRSAQTATECMRAGAFYYLTKPFEPY